MDHLSSHRLRAILQALLVTFLWSTSFVIIKWGLVEIPPLTFAGLRYVIAFFVLLPFVLRRDNISKIKNLNRTDWINLTALGIIFYTLTQGAMFVGLSLIPAVTVSLILNFTPVVVAVLAIFFISEIPTGIQWGGAALFILGILIYFLPVDIWENRTTGLIVMLIAVLANSASAVLGRNINRAGRITPLIVTVVSMGIGSIVILICGIYIQGMPAISLTNWLFIFWLAAINTAFAFTLWNKTLRTLSAMESSIINGTMLIQIAILAWIFLDEAISWKEILGMAIAATGALLVQLRAAKRT